MLPGQVLRAILTTLGHSIQSHLVLTSARRHRDKQAKYVEAGAEQRSNYMQSHTIKSRVGLCYILPTFLIFPEMCTLYTYLPNSYYTRPFVGV